MNSAAGIVCKPVGADGAPPPPWIERPIAKRQPASGRSFQRRRRSAAPSHMGAQGGDRRVARAEPAGRPRLPRAA
ncbi:Uncharacterised protein [Burkholderia pseudomallei]|nr:hypothetical protein BG24_2916 [Burkholderia pseudomallei PB08298010]ARK63270.1 hypothetical protein BOC37_26370 [Burkholderia pseudomallei]ARL21673.1 hypothetical protein BOC47_03875 [Burkholderia pseudomallei]ARL31494.1 hypothetical protein BOC48_20690 [Burkholderia pseudomallei]ARL37478.1 hypothetical protein BOC49_15460 [Burkholderia pseudomallei]